MKMKFFTTGLLFLAAFLFSLAFVSAVIQDETIVSNFGSGAAVTCPPNYDTAYNYPFEYAQDAATYKFAHCVKRTAFSAGGEYVVNSFIGETIGGECPNGANIAGSTFTDANGKTLALCIEKLTVTSLDSGVIVNDSLFKSASEGCVSGYQPKGEFTVGSQSIVQCVQFSASAADNPNCQLTNLKWVDENGAEVSEVRGWETGSDRAEGEQVYLWANASSACSQNNLNIRFRISPLSDVDVTPIDLTGEYTGGGVAVSWNPVWKQVDSIFSNNNNNQPVQYKFTAYVSNHRRGESTTLTVTRPSAAECESDSDCEEGQVCSGKACVAECSTNADCEEKYSGEKDFCNQEAGMCFECRTNDDCSEDEVCSEEGMCFDPQSECNLESALWLRMNSEGDFVPIEGGPFYGWIAPEDPNADRYKDGDSFVISAVIRGPPECRDRVTFEVYEDDFILNDFVSTIQGVRTVRWQSFRPLWDSVYIGLFEGDALEYRFRASLTNEEGVVTDTQNSGVISIQAPRLKDCLEDDECTGDEICSEGGECVPQCESNDDCSGGDVCFGNLCVECYVNDEDGVQGSCNAGLSACSEDNECVACVADSDCSANQVCNSDNECVRSNVSSCIITELQWIDTTTDEVVSRKVVGSSPLVRSHTNRDSIKGWKEGFDGEEVSGEVVLVAKVADNPSDSIQNGCADQKVVFEIFEDEPQNDEAMEGGSAMDINRDESAAYYEWGEFNWFKDARGKNPEYYFNAWIEGYEDQKVKSNTLEATKPTCDNNDQCLEKYLCFDKDCITERYCTMYGISIGKVCEEDSDCLLSHLFKLATCEAA